VHDGETLAIDDVVNQPLRRGEPVAIGKDLHAGVAVIDTSAKWCQVCAVASSRNGTAYSSA
jgi:hypothetical protein